MGHVLNIIEDNKDRQQRKSRERYQTLSKEEKENNMVVKNTKISQKMKNKG